MPRGSRFAAVAFVVTAVAVASCSESTPGRHSIAEGCSINTDCNSPLVCAFEKCHVACNDTRDCEDGARCVVSDKPFKVCQLPDERACAYNSQCPGNLVCGTDGQCRNECRVASDCIPTQVCTQGTCADEDELVDGGFPPTVTPGPTAGSTCSYNTDCAEPEVCRRGVCSLECLADRDCAPRERCTASRCTPPEVVVTAPPDAGGRPPPADAGRLCSYNSDCTDPQVCRAGTCGLECVADRDCRPDELCLASRCTVPAVVPEASPPRSEAGTPAPEAGAPRCQRTSDCLAPQVCLYGTCGFECVADGDCRSGDRCVANRCGADVPVGAPPQYGQRCNLSSDCAPPLLCGLGGQCVWECVTTADCDYAAGECCSAAHACVKGAICQGDAGSSTSPEAGADAGGAPCTSDLSCQDGLVCTGFERCVFGVCRPASKPPCDDGNPCTQDSCSESAGLCFNVPIGPPDRDLDGHYDMGCGGTADDCDDRNPDVFTGHPELCDGIDNNCNGAADEGLWTADAPVTLPGTAGEYPNSGPATIARLSSGKYVVAVAQDQVGAAAGMTAWTLDASLAVVAGPTVLSAVGGSTGCWSQAGYRVLYPSGATDGAKALVGAAFIPQTGCGGGCAHFTSSAQTFLVDDALLSTPLTLHTGAQSCSGFWWSTAPFIKWSSAHSAYVAGWSDNHLGDTATNHAYFATVSPQGGLGGARNPLPVLAENAMSADGTSPVVGPGPAGTLVAWRARDTGKVRYVVLDSALSGLLAGPTDLALAEDVYPMQAVAVGRSFLLVTAPGGSGTWRVRSLDAAGAEKGSAVIANPTGGWLASLEPVGSGALLGIKRGGAVSFGWIPENVGSSVSMKDIFDSTGSTPGIAPVDATHATMAWSDGVVKVAAVRCGP